MSIAVDKALLHLLFLSTQSSYADKDNIYEDKINLCNNSILSDRQSHNIDDGKDNRDNEDSICTAWVLLSNDSMILNGIDDEPISICILYSNIEVSKSGNMFRPRILGQKDSVLLQHCLEWDKII